LIACVQLYDLGSQKWFHGDISQKEAEGLLASASNYNGAWLVLSQGHTASLGACLNRCLVDFRFDMQLGQAISAYR